ncbi:aspartyl/asparaginyl beta-hydroxylase domain-containing protein, partial [Asaia bogorensis]|uniref:aspartyl/asparaginyl beta-hydroxylase domain-containing protein n=2 Tax=Asaia TaxID=91914 RepID=UPI0012DE4DBC
GAYNGNIYCLSKVTGEVLWESEEGEWVGASPLVVEAHNLVYFGIEYTNPSFHGSLCAYDCDSGAKIWHVPVGRLQHGSAVYCEEGDAVVWGSADHEVLSLDALTGVILWRFATRRSVKCAPAVNEKRQLAAFASFDCSIYLVSTVDGRKIGEWPTGGACYTTPLFVENIIFCGSGDGYLYIIDTIQRAIVKKIHLGGRVYSSPVLHDRSVFIGCNNGTIYEIEVSSLSIIGRFQLPDAVTNKVSVSPCGNYIYATTFMNHLFCYRRVPQETCKKPETSILGYNSAKLLKNSSCVSSARYKSERGKIFFKKISQDIDISFIYKELISNESAWYDNIRRQKNISVQRETESIFLRSADRRKLPSTIPTEDVQLSKETHVSRNFPTTMDWLSNFAKQRDKRLARAIIVRLAPGGRVYPHVDNGSYYATRDRFHLVVSSPSGSSMQAADERVRMFEGEVWWFDNKQVHHSDNPSDSHRIHVIFDLEPRIQAHQNVSSISQ